MKAIPNEGYFLAGLSLECFSPHVAPAGGVFVLQKKRSGIHARIVKDTTYTKESLRNP